MANLLLWIIFERERWCWSEVCWTLARAKIADARILGGRGASLLDGASRDRQVSLDKYKEVPKRLFFSGDAQRKPERRPTITWEAASQQRGQGFKSKDKLVFKRFGCCNRSYIHPLLSDTTPQFEIASNFLTFFCQLRSFLKLTCTKNQRLDELLRQRLLEESRWSRSIFFIR